jgi:hypothetical protein
VTSPLAITERYGLSRHVTSAFESGNEALDRWLVRYAGQSERRDAARTFVVTDAGAVIGYYALLAGELDHGEATEQTGKACHATIPSRSRFSRDLLSTGATNTVASARCCCATRRSGSSSPPSSWPFAPSSYTRSINALPASMSSSAFTR